MNNNINYNVLLDISQDGKNRNWKERKEKNLQLSSIYSEIAKSYVEKEEQYRFFQKSFRVLNCSTFLMFKRFLGNNDLKLANANFCKDRFCNICNWRRSLKVFSQVSLMIEEIKKLGNFKFLFLTLTVKNTDKENINQLCNELFAGFKRFSERDFFKNLVLGWFRAFEITYNSESDTYHPHLHLILQVPSNYVKKYYISHSTFQENWRECMRLEYQPIIWIEKVKNKKSRIDTATAFESSAIAEVAKYPIKSDIFIDNPLEVTKVLDYVMYGRRLLGFGGMFRQIRKFLKLSDLEKDKNLVNVNEKDMLDRDLAYVLEFYRWGVGASGNNYYLQGNYSVELYEQKLLEHAQKRIKKEQEKENLREARKKIKEARKQKL